MTFIRKSNNNYDNDNKILKRNFFMSIEITPIFLDSNNRTEKPIDPIESLTMVVT